MLQSSVLPFVTVFGAHFDLVLIIVFCWGALRELDEAVVWGLVGGGMIDVFSAAPFGTDILVLGIVALLAGTVGAALHRAHALLLFAAVPIITIVAYLLLGLVLEVQGWAVDWPATVATIILPACLVNLLASPVVYWLARTANSWLQSRA